MADRDTAAQNGAKSIFDQLPFDRLKDEATKGFSALGQKAIESAGNRITGATDRLNDVASGEGMVGRAAKEGAEEAAAGGSPVKGAMKGGAKGALSGAKDKIKDAIPGMGGGGGSGGKATKSTVIIEEIDVGVPISVAYNQWTQFQEFSDFMKKVESVDQEEETKVSFKAQVFWSHRTWDATIIDQVPDERIVWRSTGEKGHVDGSITFHELAPRLTRIVVVLEYYPQGFMERTGNIWRAQGRRARLELKHFRRYVMMNTMLEPDEVEGWRGEIHDSEVTRSHEDVVDDEEQVDDEAEGEYAEDEYEGEPAAEEDEYAEEPAEEGEYEEEPAEEEPEGEYEEEDYEEEPAEEGEYDEEGYEEEPQEEYAEEEEEEAPRPRRRRRG